jgi:putative tRNA adenosine deaminase-associated protein
LGGIVSAAGTNATEGFGVAVTREETAWRCSLLAPELLDDLDGVITGLRRVASSGPVFAMLAIDDEFFVIVRPIPGGATLLLSDATAGLDYDIAADVLDLLQVQIPEDDEIDDEPWPEGDLGLLADLGVTEQEMQLIVDDVDLYPDEQLSMIATRCGFADAFSAVLEKV